MICDSSMTHNNAADTTEDGRGSRSILIIKVESLPLWVPTKIKGKLAQGNRLRESQNGKEREVLKNTKTFKQKQAFKDQVSL